MAFFGWIIALATVLVVIVPFRTTAPLSAKLATAVVGLVIGIAIGTLLTGVAGRSVRSPRPRRRVHRAAAGQLHPQRERVSEARYRGFHPERNDSRRSPSATGACYWVGAGGRS